MTVVGAINVDLVVAADRLPVPGETVVGPAVQRHGGGKGANAAVAAARAGASVRLLGAVGTDDLADEAERELVAAGVDCAEVARLEDHPTGVALIVVDPAGENQIAVGAGANTAVDADRIAARVADGTARSDCVLISTEIPEAAVAAAVAAAASAGVTCVLNPAPPVAAVVDALVHRPVLTPNRGELAALVAMLARVRPGDARLRAVAGRGARNDARNDGGERAGGGAHALAEVGDQAQALAAASGAPVIVTLGAEGILVVAAGQLGRCEAPAVAVRDATGAGDTFNGVLAARLAAGEPLARAARTATVAASLSVRSVGARTGMPDAAMIRRACGAQVMSA